LFGAVSLCDHAGAAAKIIAAAIAKAEGNGTEPGPACFLADEKEVL
jgi:hypothetical protein